PSDLPLDRLSPLEVAKLAVGIEPRGLLLGYERGAAALRLGALVRERPGPPLAEVIDRRVSGDPKEPRREPVGGVEAVERLKHLQKDLLSQVDRVVAAADHPGDV